MRRNNETLTMLVGASVALALVNTALLAALVIVAIG